MAEEAGGWVWAEAAAEVDSKRRTPDDDGFMRAFWKPTRKGDHLAPENWKDRLCGESRMGLFDGKDATVHFAYATAFATAYPAVPIHPERVLVVSGLREELVSSGASMAWWPRCPPLVAASS
jgi:hypothetical protein